MAYKFRSYVNQAESIFLSLDTVQRCLSKKVILGCLEICIDSVSGRFSKDQVTAILMKSINQISSKKNHLKTLTVLDFQQIHYQKKISKHPSLILFLH